MKSAYWRPTILNIQFEYSSFWYHSLGKSFGTPSISYLHQFGKSFFSKRFGTTSISHLHQFGKPFLVKDLVSVAFLIVNS